MALTRKVLKSRTVREAMLKLLYRMFGANPEIAVAAEHVYEGFAGSKLQYTREDVDPELVDLIEDGLVAVEELPSDGDLPAKGYKITSRGRDFVRANFPWGRIDEYTGAQP